MALPQREGRPTLNINPEASTPNTASWDEHYDNVGANELNHPVPERKGGPDANGWLHEAYDTVQEDEV
jgi:hypothetical protein